ncbi:MAG TPA: hypothetical protein VMT23_00355, partial [Candidatus Binatia bacterium]|nr:hypothetical protein [Candidatus Binatia bacterium]
MGIFISLIATIAWFLAMPHGASAAGIVGFTKAEISAIDSNGSTFYFKDSSTIVGNISHNGTVQEVTFTGSGSPVADPSRQYIYTNSDSFCQPPNPVTGYAKVSQVVVIFSSINPLQGKIISSGSTGPASGSYLWPGPNPQNCGTTVGASPSLFPVNISQDKITPKQNAPTGKGSQYTTATVKAATYKFTQNGGLIQMSFPGTSIDPITFADQQPYDKTYGFVSPSFFCDGNNGSKTASLTLQPGSAGFSADTIKAQLTLSYFNGNTCVTDQKLTINVTNPDDALSDGTTAKLAQEFAQWDDTSIDILKCSPEQSSCSTDFSLSLQNGSGNTTYLQSPDSSCGGYTLELDEPGKNTGTFYKSSGAPCVKSDSRVVAVLGTKGQASDTNTGDGGAGSTGSDSSACSFNNGSALDVGLQWILCPVIKGLSASADAIDKYVEGQLNFSTKDNLGQSVKNAWSIFKDLASSLVVILLLVMVFAQAIGGNFLDPYMVKKMLPKLIIAVIAMQISWYICVWFIELANAAGQGIAQIMAAPFGGTASLELPALLKRLSEVWLLITGGAVTGAVVAAPVLIITGVVGAGTLLSFGWPILVLIILTIVIAVIVALATLLVRNALIILLVMLSPLAFLAWVLPGTQNYWKMWKDNFTRVLVFFPLVMAMIYAGRIFAWTAGNLGAAGPLDLIMVLVGFFGPYFFLPKAFKWGGPLLSAASNGINNAWPVKKGREVANRELLAAQKRKQHELVDKYYSSAEPITEDGQRASRRDRLRAALKRGVVRTAAGQPIPTARSTWSMMQESGKWKQDEIGLLEGKMNNEYKEYQKRFGVMKAKEMIRDKYYDPTGKKAFQNRAFFTWAYDTKSFMEMGEPRWRTGGGKYGDMFKTQGWIDFMHGNPQAYGDFSSRLGGSVPYRLPLGGGPKMEDYMPGGKRYNILNNTDEIDEETGEVVRNSDGTAKPNKHYNPKLKEIIDAGGGRAEQAAELMADTERFMKTIDQAEDPG